MNNKKKQTMLRPTDDRLIIRPETPPSQSKGGIVLPTSDRREKPQKGLVLAAGPGKRTNQGVVVPMQVAVGDCVIINKYSAHEVEHEEEILLVISESEVLAIV